MAQKRALTQKELEYIAENWSDFNCSDEEEEPYSAGSSDKYIPGSNSLKKQILRKGNLFNVQKLFVFIVRKWEELLRQINL